MFWSARMVWISTYHHVKFGAAQPSQTAAAEKVGYLGFLSVML